MIKRTIRVAVVLATAAFVSLAAAPAQATPGTAGPHGEFRIHVSRVNGGGSASIALSCPPGWNEHPNAAKACGQLEAVDGYIEEIEPLDGLCTKQYDPVRVLVMGNWHGAQHVFLEKYGNRCEANLATGGYLLDF